MPNMKESGAGSMPFKRSASILAATITASTSPTPTAIPPPTPILAPTLAAVPSPPPPSPTLAIVAEPAPSTFSSTPSITVGLPQTVLRHAYYGQVESTFPPLAAGISSEQPTVSAQPSASPIFASGVSEERVEPEEGSIDGRSTVLYSGFAKEAGFVFDQGHADVEDTRGSNIGTSGVISEKSSSVILSQQSLPSSSRGNTAEGPEASLQSFITASSLSAEISVLQRTWLFSSTGSVVDAPVIVTTQTQAQEAGEQAPQRSRPYDGENRRSPRDEHESNEEERERERREDEKRLRDLKEIRLSEGVLGIGVGFHLEDLEFHGDLALPASTCTAPYTPGLVKQVVTPAGEYTSATIDPTTVSRGSSTTRNSSPSETTYTTPLPIHCPPSTLPLPSSSTPTLNSWVHRISRLISSSTTTVAPTTTSATATTLNLVPKLNTSYNPNLIGRTVSERDAYATVAVRPSFDTITNDRSDRVVDVDNTPDTNLDLDVKDDTNTSVNIHSHTNDTLATQASPSPATTAPSTWKRRVGSISSVQGLWNSARNWVVPFRSSSSTSVTGSTSDSRTSFVRSSTLGSATGTLASFSSTEATGPSTDPTPAKAEGDEPASSNITIISRIHSVSGRSPPRSVPLRIPTTTNPASSKEIVAGSGELYRNNTTYTHSDTTNTNTTPSITLPLALSYSEANSSSFASSILAEIMRSNGFGHGHGKDRERGERTDRGDRVDRDGAERDRTDRERERHRAERAERSVRERERLERGESVRETRNWERDRDRGYTNGNGASGDSNVGSSSSNGHRRPSMPNIRHQQLQIQQQQQSQAVPISSSQATLDGYMFGINAGGGRVEDYMVRPSTTQPNLGGGSVRVLEERTRRLEERNRLLEERNRALEEKSRGLEERNRAQDARNRQLEGEVFSLEERNRQLEDLTNQLDERIHQLDGSCKSLERSLKELQTRLRAKEGEIKSVENVLRTRDSELRAKDGEVRRLEGDVRKVENELRAVKDTAVRSVGPSSTNPSLSGSAYSSTMTNSNGTSSAVSKLESTIRVLESQLKSREMEMQDALRSRDGSVGGSSGSSGTHGDRKERGNAGIDGSSSGRRKRSATVVGDHELGMDSNHLADLRRRASASPLAHRKPGNYPPNSLSSSPGPNSGSKSGRRAHSRHSSLDLDDMPAVNGRGVLSTSAPSSGFVGNRFSPGQAPIQTNRVEGLGRSGTGWTTNAGSGSAAHGDKSGESSSGSSCSSSGSSAVSPRSSRSDSTSKQSDLEVTKTPRTGKLEIEIANTTPMPETTFVDLSTPTARKHAPLPSSSSKASHHINIVPPPPRLSTTKSNPVSSISIPPTLSSMPSTSTLSSLATNTSLKSTISTSATSTLSENFAQHRSLETFMTRTDTWSGAQVLQAVHDINSQILQFAASATEMCKFGVREVVSPVVSHAVAAGSSPTTSTAQNITSKVDPALKNSRAYVDTLGRLGPALTNLLATYDHSNDPILVQLGLQTLVCVACKKAWESFCLGLPGKSDGVLAVIYRSLREFEPQPTSAKWRALTHSHIHSIYPTLSAYSATELADTVLRWTFDVLVLAGCTSVECGGPSTPVSTSTVFPLTPTSSTSSTSSLPNSNNPSFKYSTSSGSNPTSPPVSYPLTPQTLHSRTSLLPQLNHVTTALTTLENVLRQDILSTSFDLVIPEFGKPFVKGGMSDTFGAGGVGATGSGNSANGKPVTGKVLGCVEIGLACRTRVGVKGPPPSPATPGTPGGGRGYLGSGSAGLSNGGGTAVHGQANAGGGGHRPEAIYEERLLLLPKVVLESVVELL